ncbi:MAG: hypothetical protein IJ165_05055 [Proteobacteria bacterium]|nr:hypothetical protein [Pseudomonadota bacterium]
MSIQRMRKFVAVVSAVCVAGIVLTGCQQKVSVNGQTSEGHGASVEERPEPPRDAFAFSEDALEPLGPAEQSERAAAHDVFVAFKNAVLGYRGEEAAGYLSAGSLDYYENLLVAARLLNRDPESFKVAELRMSPAVRTNVILVTRRLAPSYLESISARELYVTGFNQGWIGYKTLSTASVDNLLAYRKDGERYLVGDIYYKGTGKDKVVMRLGFSLEDNVWKIDLVPLFVGIDLTLNKFLQEKDADADMTIEETVKETQAALEPSAWQPSVQKKDGFSVKFPRAPLYAEDGSEHIYSARHYKYGQFDVRMQHYADTPDSPYHQKALRDAQLMRFFRPLNIQQPKCRQHIVNEDYFIQCDFEVPAHDSQGKTVFVFSPTKMFQLFNIARTDSYQNDVAAYFMSSFGYER